VPQRTVPPDLLPSVHAYMCRNGIVSVRKERPSGHEIMGLKLIVRYPRELTAPLKNKKRR
jgi:hypothetical protein